LVSTRVLAKAGACDSASGNADNSKNSSNCVPDVDSSGWETEEYAVLSGLLVEGGQQRDAASCHGFDIQPRCSAADAAAALGLHMAEDFDVGDVVDALDRLVRPLLFRGCAEPLWPGRDQLGRQSLSDGPLAKQKIWTGKFPVLSALVGDSDLVDMAVGTKTMTLRQCLRRNFSGFVFDTGNEMRQLGEKIVKLALGVKHRGIMQDHPLKVLHVGLPAVPGKGFPNPVLSLGARGEGTSLHRHGHAMLGLLSGRKLWLVAPETVNPPMRTLRWDHWARHMKWPFVRNLTDNGRWTLCVQEPGDVIILPKGWWHGTANLKEGLGIGRQNAIYRKVYQEDSKRLKNIAETDADNLGHRVAMLDLEFLKPVVNYNAVRKGFKQLQQEIMQAMKQGEVDTRFAKGALAFLIHEMVVDEAGERKMDFFMNTDRGRRFVKRWWQDIWKIDPDYDPLGFGHHFD